MHCYVVSLVAVTPQPKGLIELIEYSYQQVATSFPEADLEKTPKLSVQKRHVLVCEGSLCPIKLPDVNGPGLGEAGRYNLPPPFPPSY